MDDLAKKVGAGKNLGETASPGHAPPHEL